MYKKRLLEGGEPAYEPPESRIVPLAPPPALEVGVALPADGTPGPVPQPVPTVPSAPVGVQPGRAPVYQPPLPDAGAGGAVSAPPVAAGTPLVGGEVVSREAPAYQPPVPGAVSAGPASGDRPVYLPPLPADK